MMRRVLVTLLLVVGLSFGFMSQAAAFDIFSPRPDCGRTTSSSASDCKSPVDCSGNAGGSTVCESKINGDDDPISGANGILANVTDIMALVAGMAAVIVLVVSGIRYITSDGDPQNVKSAKSTAMYALIGLVVIVAARAIIYYVILNI